MRIAELNKFMRIAEKLIDLHDSENNEYENDIYLISTKKTNGKPKTFDEKNIIYHGIKIK